ncbi:MAG TPA: hypothetical protein PLL32_04180 [Anaeromyxobacteraceae bacterium]|nr:hypothetical protein [Anaeromyxobacteraceae bacterium]
MTVLRLLAAASAFAVASAASPAHGQVGFTFAGRVGASLPFGDAFRTSTGTPVPVAENSTGSIPLQLDVGVTLARHTFVGAYGQYRFGLLRSGACPEGASCSETGVRTGVEVIYSFATARSGLGAWVGLGTGWEWSTSRGSSAAGSATLTLSGWEFFQAQVGFDLWMTSAWRMGYYVAGSLGQYSQASATADGVTSAFPIPERALHSWIEMGFKTTFDL